MNAPIFLFSLPRSGSTLLQRVLMSHPDIASVAEPWLMLPFCYAFKEEGTLTEYSHITCHEALHDFIENLPDKEKDYYEALRLFSTVLYEKQCQGEKYFLDKTPRYYNIIPEIAKTFPDAKFIFLFRNPVHIKASVIHTWGEGRLKYLYKFHRDLTRGVQLMSEGYELLKHKAYGIQYEQFITDPEKYLKELCHYLEISFHPNMLNNFSTQNTKGRMGDPTGVKQYTRINNTTLDKWKTIFHNSFRKKILRNYIESIDEHTLSIQNYNKDKILKEIETLYVQKSLCLQDRVDLLFSKLMRFVKPNIWSNRHLGKWAKDQFLS